jgi:demethoxyubiquinone hydroxylase (CLK1/Coq7/Cat5 family)
LTGAGALVGAAAGPIGAVAGAVAGSIAGGLLGKKMAETVHPTDPNIETFGMEPDVESDRVAVAEEVPERTSGRFSQSERTDTLDKLLRGELAAVETYRQALEKLGGQDGMYPLTGITQEHRQAVFALSDHITERGGIPSSTSGAWDTWAKTIEGSAAMFGKNAALKALKEGEEHGIKEYEEAVKDPNLESECVTLIQFQLLPQTRQHVAALEQMMAGNT